MKTLNPRFSQECDLPLSYFHEACFSFKLQLKYLEQLCFNLRSAFICLSSPCRILAFLVEEEDLPVLDCWGVRGGRDVLIRVVLMHLL